MSTPADAAPRHRVRRWLAERGLRQWWKAGVAAILAVAALFGGLDTVNTAVTSVPPGQPFSDGAFTVTVQRATVVPEVRGGGSVLAPQKPGRRYLGVVATVRNDGTVPWTLANELDLRGQPDQQFVGVMRVADGSRILTLGPGLTEQLAFVWEVPETALAPGDPVTLRIWKKQFQQGYVVYGELWVDSLTEYGEIVIPVGGGS
ncbi:hypothetical protein [Mycolicibacterium sp.]|uniref:hypothetical protein n=1 Tax=Mycolicibacterium sp. TaxID=2320850 RepID=UPI003D1429AE